MKKHLIAVLATVTFILATPFVDGQGILGERYFGLQAGYIRISNGDSFDGFGVGTGVNIPIVKEKIGVDLLPMFSLSRLSENNIDLDTRTISADLIVFPNPEAEIKPFVGIGIGWGESKISAPGFLSITEDSFFTSYMIGIEFAANRFGIRPSIGYTWFEDDDFDNSWDFGASANFWIDEHWSLFAGVFYSDSDNDFDAVSITGGILFAF